MKENFSVFDRISIKINPVEVIRQLGYSHADDVSGRLRKRIEQETVQVLQLIEPKGAYLVLEQLQRQDFELFANAERIVLALATIGPAVELRARKMLENNESTRGLIVDAAGTIAAEQTADFVERRIRRHFTNSGFKISRRYAPGYCGWDITAQRDIFAHFPDTLGIELTESCLMVPEKSLSFVSLLSRSGDFKAIKVGDCRNCRQERCPYRLVPYEAVSQD
jgi:hypothetical protein